jgi:hypothetical protein
MQISNCLCLLRLADKSARRYGPSRGLADAGRRMTDSEDHRLCRLRRGKPFRSLEVSDEALRLVLVLLLHRDRSLRPRLGPSHCDSGNYSPAVFSCERASRQPRRRLTVQDYFSPGGVVGPASLEVPLSRAYHVGLHAVHVANIFSV